MSTLPIVLCVGIDNSRPEDIAESIVNHDRVTEAMNHDIDDGYEWKIDTKYYTANAQFRLLSNKNIFSEDIRDYVEAVILYVDHSVDLLVREFKEWDSTMKDTKPDVKVIVSKKPLNRNQKDEVEDWCRENDYELIELEKDEQNSDCISDEEDILGIQRVVEVLQTHEWSNLLLKEKTRQKNSGHVERNENFVSSTNHIDKELPQESSNSDSNVENLDDMEELFDLFQNLKSMKLNISSLSKAEKLDKAEKVVKTFWNAIGGDMNEFSESDDEIT